MKNENKKIQKKKKTKEKVDKVQVLVSVMPKP